MCLSHPLFFNGADYLCRMSAPYQQSGRHLIISSEVVRVPFEYVQSTIHRLSTIKPSHLPGLRCHLFVNFASRRVTLNWPNAPLHLSNGSFSKGPLLSTGLLVLTLHISNRPQLRRIPHDTRQALSSGITASRKVSSGFQLPSCVLPRSRSADMGEEASPLYG